MENFLLNQDCTTGKCWPHRDKDREGMLFKAGFGRYLAAHEIIRQSPSMDLKSKSAASAPKIWVVMK